MSALNNLVNEDGIFRNGFMAYDSKISMDFPMPEELREYIDGMDKALAESDLRTWDYYHEVIGEFAKSCYLQGEISSDQMHAIWERYGTAG